MSDPAGQAAHGEQHGEEVRGEAHGTVDQAGGEGALLKKATVATKVGGIPEMIQHNETGLLITPKDKTDVANKIEMLLNDKNLIKNLGENFYNYVCQHFSDEAMAKTHIEIYKNILKEK